MRQRKKTPLRTAVPLSPQKQDTFHLAPSQWNPRAKRKLAPAENASDQQLMSICLSGSFAPRRATRAHIIESSGANLAASSTKSNSSVRLLSTRTISFSAVNFATRLRLINASRRSPRLR